MIRSLYTASTGMQAQEMAIDVISNNLANVNTTGFKKGRAEFQDLLYQTLEEAGTPTGDGGRTPVAVTVGHGVRPVATSLQVTQGDLLQTQNPTDLAIEGQGYFKLLHPSGEHVYTRAGNLKVDADGRLVNVDGLPLDPPITVPPEAEVLDISRGGAVTVKVGGQDERSELGTIELAHFINPNGLSPLGRGLFEATEASGQPQLGPPGQEGFGEVAQGVLESSNVKVVEEMIALITAQRAYEVNSKVIQASDQMLRQAANVRQ